jgi:hypothetical protein
MTKNSAWLILEDLSNPYEIPLVLGEKARISAWSLGLLDRFVGLAEMAPKIDGSSTSASCTSWGERLSDPANSPRFRSVHLRSNSNPSSGLAQTTRASWHWYHQIMGLGSAVSCVIFDIGFVSSRLRQSPIEGTASELLEMTSLEISAAMLKRDWRGPCGTRDSNYGSPQITLILQDGRSDSLQCGWLGPQQAFDCEGLACDLWGDRCPPFEEVVP